MKLTLYPCYITNRNENRIISLMTGNEKQLESDMSFQIYQYFDIAS